jgi:hypothetical protein
MRSLVLVRQGQRHLVEAVEVDHGVGPVAQAEQPGDAHELLRLLEARVRVVERLHRAPGEARILLEHPGELVAGVDRESRGDRSADDQDGVLVLRDARAEVREHAARVVLLLRAEVGMEDAEGALLAAVGVARGDGVEEAPRQVRAAADLATSRPGIVRLAAVREPRAVGALGEETRDEERDGGHRELPEDPPGAGHGAGSYSGGARAVEGAA